MTNIIISTVAQNKLTDYTKQTSYQGLIVVVTEVLGNGLFDNHQVHHACIVEQQC